MILIQDLVWGAKNIKQQFSFPENKFFPAALKQQPEQQQAATF